MKRLGLVVALIAIAADAAPDVDPWVKVNDQREYTKPVQFDREVYFSSVDAGTALFSGISVTNETVTSTSKVAILDAGVANINGQLQVAGTSVLTGVTGTTANFTTSTNTVFATITGIDAGQIVVGGLNATGTANTPFLTTNTIDAGSVRVSGLYALVSHSVDAGLEQESIEQGYVAMSNGAITVTFQTAFSIGPNCQCTHVNTTNSNPCVLTAIPTTTQAAFAVTSGSTDRIYYLCIGAK